MVKQRGESVTPLYNDWINNQCINKNTSFQQNQETLGRLTFWIHPFLSLYGPYSSERLSTVSSRSMKHVLQIPTTTSKDCMTVVVKLLHEQLSSQQAHIVILAICI